MNPLNQPKIKYIESDNKFNAYTNHTGISVSVFDLRLIFGQNVPEESPGATEVTVARLGSVLMSPLHAKLLCANLQTNIQTYESMFGEIKIPVQVLVPAK